MRMLRNIKPRFQILPCTKATSWNSIAKPSLMMGKKLCHYQIYPKSIAQYYSFSNSLNCTLRGVWECGCNCFSKYFFIGNTLK
jgi:hypothetical protein